MSEIELNTYQKAVALNALAPIALSLNMNDRWYVRQAIAIKGQNIERSVGADPQTTTDAAIEKYWLTITQRLGKDEAILVRDKNLLVKWNGFMWLEVPKPVQFKEGAHS